MNTQYEVVAVGDFEFEREMVTKRGTQYRCTVCNAATKRLRLKGVFTELEGVERSRFRQRMNAMHQRHRKVCATTTRVGKDDGGSGGVGAGDEFDKAENGSRGSAGEAGGDVESVGAKGCEAGSGMPAGGTGSTSGGITANKDPEREGKEEKEEEEEEAISPPIEAQSIRSWTESDILSSFGYHHLIPAAVTKMRVFSRPSRTIQSVRCTLSNSHGEKEFTLPSTLFAMWSEPRAMYEEALDRWRRETSLERAALLDMFENAYANQPEELRCALEAIQK